MIYLGLITNKDENLKEFNDMISKQTNQNFRKIIIQNNDSEFWSPNGSRYSRKGLETIGDLRNLVIECFLEESANDNDYLLMLDDDDILSDNWIDESYKTIETNSYPDFIYVGNYDRYNGDIFEKSYDYTLSFENYRKLLCPFYSVGYLYKKTLLNMDNMKYAKISYGEEIPFIYNVLKYSKNIVKMNNVHYKYIRKDNCMTSTETTSWETIITHAYLASKNIDDDEFICNLLIQETKYIRGHYDKD